MPSSLYNVGTLKTLIAAGESSGNMITSQSLTFDQAVKSQIEVWQKLSQTLGFCKETDLSQCDTQHVYMIYLWLETLFEETFQRKSEGGSIELGVVPTLGS